ncbi:unnamed protein product, partial [Ectocarpus fasciculatus]
PATHSSSCLTHLLRRQGSTPTADGTERVINCESASLLLVEAGGRESAPILHPSCRTGTHTRGSLHFQESSSNIMKAAAVSLAGAVLLSRAPAAAAVGDQPTIAGSRAPPMVSSWTKAPREGRRRIRNADLHR